MPPEAWITGYPNGPLLVRGDFEIVDADGAKHPRPRQTVALCRCGKSRIKPLCDGTHKLAGFQTATAEEGVIGASSADSPRSQEPSSDRANSPSR